MAVQPQCAGCHCSMQPEKNISRKKKVKTNQNKENLNFD
jgi:hypothetical protein